jgi:hypothetical protein
MATSKKYSPEIRERAIAAGVPVTLMLVGVLFVWLHWYAAGTVVDLT